MSRPLLNQERGDPAARAFYRDAIEVLQASELPFLIGGAHALRYYTGVVRDTKDLDVFVYPADWERALGAFAAAGYQTEVTYVHWLGKALSGEHFVDIIFSSGNSVATVDHEWFEHAAQADLLGRSVQLCPPEEILWSKAFTMERDRYDGADVAHLLLVYGERLDWTRLVRRFGDHWHVLLAQLVLFDFIYPSERAQIPDWVVTELLGRWRAERTSAPPNERLCRGTLLSGAQFLIDVEEWGYRDGRLVPWGSLTPDQVIQWKAAVQRGA